MTDKEKIVRQAEKIIELEDKLAETNEVKNHFFRQYEGSLPVQKFYCGRHLN